MYDSGLLIIYTISVNMARANIISEKGGCLTGVNDLSGAHVMMPLTCREGII